MILSDALEADRRRGLELDAGARPIAPGVAPAPRSNGSRLDGQVRVLDSADAAQDKREGSLEYARLIRRARDLDADAFAEVYDRSVRSVYRYLSVRLSNAHDAEELTQEVFVAALAKMGSLRAEDEPAVMAWLFQIARHKLADYLRRRYRRPSAPLDLAENMDAGGPSLAELAELSEDKEELCDALEQLTDKQRDVLICKYVLEYDNARTAQVLGKNTNAVNQLHHRAIDSLHRLLAGTGRRAK